MKIRLIACEVLKREFQAVAARSSNQIDFDFKAKWLHDLGAERMLSELQAAVNAVDRESCDAVVMGYGLCNNGVAGLRAGVHPLVIPRAHDCVTLFMGDRKRYLDYFNAHPGVYFMTSGWLEYEDNPDLENHSIQRKLGMDSDYRELVEKYGEDNAKYIYETLCEGTRNYHQITFIKMGVEPDDQFRNQAVAEASKREWDFEEIDGDLSLFQRLVDGEWDEADCLTLRPGESVKPSYDDDILKADGSISS